MRSTMIKALLAASAVAATLSMSSQAATDPADKLVGARVDNFTLADQTGLGHELYYFKARPAIVLVSTVAGDAVSDRALAQVGSIKSAFEAKGVAFYALDSKSKAPDLLNPPKSVVPILYDELQLVGRSMGVTQTGEVFVVVPGTWTVAYHGSVDGLQAALDAVVAGKGPTKASTPVKGTPIAFPDRSKAKEFTKISYAKEVAPILAEKCVSCHTTGGLGPFAMDRYEAVKGFAPMIRETLRTKRMPPYHADPHTGHWQNDMSLSPAQIKTVVNWVEAGAPRGSGSDPLAAKKVIPAEWPMGKPDLVLTIPAFNVPATGVIDYQDWSIPSKLTEGKWLRATAWKPGAIPVVHHALGGWMPEVRADGRGFSWNTSTGGYGPGGESNLSPASTGTYIPPGGSFTFQMHYTPVGKPLKDETQVGLYFYKDQPNYILRQASVTDFSLEIPAGKERHHERAYLEFPRDALLYGTQPHCHSRCYSTKLTIVYPDGKEKVILNQPRYDFGWQREYIFDKMFEVPAGSKLIADYVFDNSTANASNPDPKRNVTFGEQTQDEMLFTFVRFRFKDETSTNRHDEYMAELQNGMLFGALDDDLNGKVTAAEFRGPMFASLKAMIPLVDSNKDGGVDKTEMAAIMSRMGGGGLGALLGGGGGAGGQPRAGIDPAARQMITGGTK